MTNLQNLDVSFLVCPETKQCLHSCSLSEAERKIAQDDKLTARKTGKPGAFGPTTTVLLRDDLKCAYPVIDGIPILLSPECLRVGKDVREYDLSDPKYSEAYEEMTFYNEVASKEAGMIEDSQTYKNLKSVLQVLPDERSKFPCPKEIWIDAVYDCAAQWDAYKYISPVKGKRLLQLGGKGIHAVKWLLAGAEEAWVGTPMLGEARYAMALAEAMGVVDRLRCVVLIGEEMPFADDIFDGIYSGGCLHHMVIPLVLSECAHVLREGGRFSSSDPWKAPLYTIGTKVLGKREKGVYCRPITKERIESLYASFREAHEVHHGTLFRYFLLALNKFGIKTSLKNAWRINRVDDALCGLIPGLRRWGSSVVILGEK